jgi:hypothetical protein
MKRVKIWQPELKREKKGKKVVISIIEKRGKLLSRRAVMDRTLQEAEDGGDDFIINRKQFIEADPDWKPEDAEPGTGALGAEDTGGGSNDQGSPDPQNEGGGKSIGQKIADFFGGTSDATHDRKSQLDALEEDRLIDLADELELDDIPDNKEDLVQAILDAEAQSGN